MSKFVIFSVLINLVSCYNATDELLSVVVIFRHGDRTPVQPYPNDPYRNRSYWPVGFGQLTNLGKMRQYQLGQWFRNRYDGFLPVTYSEKDIYVRSTDVDRTLMSAESNLAGLYPPISKQIWDPDLLWQPIPIHTTPELQDPLLAMKKNCPQYNKLLKDLFNSPYFINVAHKNHDLYAYLTRYTGTLISSLESLEYIYNTLFIETHNNFTIPDWASKVYPDKLKPWASLSFATACFTPELARLKAGLLFGEIIEHFQNRSGDNYRKFLMYSGHDMTIANVLNTMGAFQYHCPPYASTVIFELRRLNNKTNYVNVFYKNSTEVQKIVVKGCDFDCKFEDFVRVLSPVVLTMDQWHKECRLSLLYYLKFDHVGFGVLIAIAGCLFIVATTVFAGVKCRKRGKDITSYTQLPSDEVA